MPTITKRVHYPINCGVCQKQFPIIVEVETGQEGNTEKEIECPFCKTLLVIEFPHRLPQGEMLRGTKKL